MLTNMVLLYSAKWKNLTKYNREETAVRSATLRGICVHTYGYFEEDNLLGEQCGSSCKI